MRKKIIATLLIIASVSSLILMFVLQDKIHDGRRMEGRCMEDDGPSKHTMLLIDRTDKYDSDSIERLEKLILRIASKVEKEELFSLLSYDISLKIM